MGRFDGWTGGRIAGHLRELGHRYPVAFRDPQGTERAGKVFFDDMAGNDPGASGGEFVWWLLEMDGEGFVGNMPLVAGDAMWIVRGEGYAASQHAGGCGWLTGPAFAREAEVALRRAADGAGILAREPRRTGDSGLRPLAFR